MRQSVYLSSVEPSQEILPPFAPLTRKEGCKSLTHIHTHTHVQTQISVSVICLWRAGWVSGLKRGLLMAGGEWGRGGRPCQLSHND